MTHERIIGVAVRLNGEVYGLPAPARHGQVLRLIGACMPDDPDAPHKAEQGFITDRARFVTREEARHVVQWEMARTTAPRLVHYPRLKDHGRWEPSHHATQLFSEDLW
jgi:hypothetical protein